MTEIEPTEWSFDAIGDVDSARAERLRSVGTRAELVQELARTFGEAITRKSARFAVDSRCNTFIECRIIVQFPVSPKLYDWFFNSRNGYRAQFWKAPTEGAQFNEKIIEELAKCLKSVTQKGFEACRITVTIDNGSRKERDVGRMTMPRDDVISSLAPNISKIWICEHRVSTDGGDPEPIFLSVFGDEQNQPKLIIPKWTDATGCTGEGLRAPFPAAEYSWLDLKGGFLNENGNISQIKCEDTRAHQINKCGWT